ncbi:MAG TPA: family 1 glycosylhydrolase [Rhabdochlamydiaceae bacterium]
MVYACNNAVWSALEHCLVPPSATTTWYYSTLLKKSLGAVCLFPLGVITGGFVGVHKVYSFAVSFLRSPVIIDPKTNFQAVVDDAKLWSKIGTDAEIERDLIRNPSNLPEPEIEGVGTATFQDSPLFCPDSQWADWQLKKIPAAHRPGRNSNLFELYKTSAGRKEIIDRLKQLHVTHYRFSIEWSHLEPNEGEWIEANMQVYTDLCKDLREAKIAPNGTLLHFSEPKWFHDKDSFEKKENIQYFERFAVKAFNRLTEDYKGRPLVEWFCTINEPAIDAFSRYVLGTFSPGFFMRFAKAGNFLKNALEAHCVVYERFKKRHLPTVKVGIIHQYLRMRPTNPLLIPALKYFTRLINEVPMNFFRSGGKFDFKVPFLCNIEEQSTHVPETDFVGTQYYTRPWIGLTGPTSYGEPMTKMPFHEDSAGIYEAIKETHAAFNAPVLITETGISTENDEQRSRFMLRTRYAIREAAKDLGIENVLGVSWWCFGDNMELERGMTQPFGLFPLTAKGLASMPKPGTQASIRVAEAWRARPKVVEKIA